MILADTSIWIEFLKQISPIFSAMRLCLENQKILTTEFIFGELLQGAKDVDEERILCDYWESLPRIRSKDVFIEAGMLARRERFCQKGVGLIDAAILVSARHHRAKVWTLDKKLLRILSEAETFKGI